MALLGGWVAIRRPPTRGAAGGVDSKTLEALVATVIWRRAGDHSRTRVGVPLQARGMPKRDPTYPIVMLTSSMLPWYWSSPSSLRPMVTGLVFVIDPIVMGLVNVLPSTITPI
jgi:hypothetical protein